MKKNWTLTDTLATGGHTHKMYLKINELIIENEICNFNYSEEIAAGFCGGVVIKNAKIKLLDTNDIMQTITKGSWISICCAAKKTEADQFIENVYEEMIVEDIKKIDDYIKMYEITLTNNTRQLQQLRNLSVTKVNDTTIGAIVTDIMQSNNLKYENQTSTTSICKYFNTTAKNLFEFLNKAGECDGVLFSNLKDTITRKTGGFVNSFNYNYHNFLQNTSTTEINKKDSVEFNVFNFSKDENEVEIMKHEQKAADVVELNIDTREFVLTKIVTNAHTYNVVSNKNQSYVTLKYTNIVTTDSILTFKVFGRRLIKNKTASIDSNKKYIDNELITIQNPVRLAAICNENKIKINMIVDGFDVGEVIKINEIDILVTKINITSFDLKGVVEGVVYDATKYNIT